MPINNEGLETQEFQLNMGPQHPSTHGVFRAVLTIDGENIVNEENKIGYLHRGIEKIAESKTYTQFIPYTDRLDYLSGMLNNLGYVQTVEKLIGAEIPERAEYIRIIMAELQRIANHLVFIASCAIDLNAVTGWMYAMTAREMILDLFEMTCGARMMVNYMRIGGVSADLPEEFLPAIKKFFVEMPVRLDELDALVAQNIIFQGRTKGIAVLDTETAIEYGVTGPNLRATGMKFDLRKAAPYGFYDRIDFDIPVLKNGDSFDRFYIRFLEVRQSMRIIQQAVELLPEGPVMGKVPKMLKPNKGEVFHQIEGSKGQLGFYVVSDGSAKPYRVHIKSPSFANIGAIPKVAAGIAVQDFITLLATFDFVLGEVDR